MKFALTVIALIGLIALVNNMTHDDEVSDQEHYCEMVKTKSWPDYKGIYKKHCPQ
jgi:hypothetical protein